MSDRFTSIGRMVAGGVAAVFAAALLALSPARASAQPLRVCADPDYLPYSNRAQQGFENKIAAAVATALGETVRYTWKTTRGTGGFDQFIQDTLNAKRCDLIVDVPYAIQGMLATHPYYVSSYVFVYPKKKNYDIQSMDSPDLRKLRIGYETDTPGESGLKIRALILHGVPFDIGDTEGASPREMLDALKSGRIAVAVTWEPAIGLYLHSFPNLEVTAVPNSRSQGSPEQYAFPMAMAVRTGDTKLQTQLNRVIANKQPELTRILTRYGVKLYQPGLNL